eukprot:3209601-Pleurochrysis_carterae.AAC.1
MLPTTSLARIHRRHRTSRAHVASAMELLRYTVAATEPLAHTLTAPWSSSVFSRVTAFPREHDSAFRAGRPRDSFNYGPLSAPSQSILQLRFHSVPESDGLLHHICGP